MLNIKGLVKITKFEVLSEKSVKATVYFGTKKNGKDGEEWENSFFNAVLVGEAVEKSYEVQEKDSIYVTKGIVKNVSYTAKDGSNRSYLSLTIFDFVHGEDEITKVLEQFKTGETKKTEKPRRERKQKWNSKDSEDLILIDDGDIPF